MNTLTVNIQREWLARILDGSKKIEYRDATDYWLSRLTCTTADFADLRQTVMREPWDATKAATAPAERQRLRDELDALVAHLYHLTREDLEHILGAFPLVFPDDEAGAAKKSALLWVYDQFAEEPWPSN